MMPTCVYTPGLADIGANPPILNLPPGFGIDRPADVPFEVWSPNPATRLASSPVTPGYDPGKVYGINELMQVPAGGLDWTTLLIYGGVALVVVMLISKGRR